MNDIAPRSGFIPAAGDTLFYREAGDGPPVIVLHGGPDFDHQYLLPDLDRLADAYRLIYYDQRGRGRSRGNVRPEDVSIASEIADLEAVRAHLQLPAIAVLGHSWGALLALEYAIRHPDRVSHLILMNAAPASHEDLQLMRQERRRTEADDIARLMAIAATARYQTGDLEADAEYYRIHFRTAVTRPEHLDQLMRHLRAGATPEGIRTARAIEDRLVAETWQRPEYSLLTQLAALAMPTLVIHGEHDIIPIACAEHIAHAIPGARLVLIEGSGHFSYLDAPDTVRSAIDALFRQE